MSVSSRYRRAWEGFWGEAPEERGAVFWDAEPEITAARHLTLLEPHLLAPDLPFVDLGCGNGTQTRFLAGRFPTVVGVDLAAAAVDLARRSDPGGLASYRRLDAAEPSEAAGLHAEFGDANVYLRGVLHQCVADDRQPLADGIATLLGSRGRALVVEPSPAAKAVLMGLAREPAGPSAKLAPVFRHGLTPAEAGEDEVAGHLRAAGLTVLDGGELPLVTTEHGVDGRPLELPALWLVAGVSAPAGDA
ncbi:methyltransferase domain-containing protein [Streptomyces sp. ZYX-F-203]